MSRHEVLPERSVGFEVLEQGTDFSAVGGVGGFLAVRASLAENLDFEGFGDGEDMGGS